MLLPAALLWAACYGLLWPGMRRAHPVLQGLSFVVPWVASSAVMASSNGTGFGPWLAPTGYTWLGACLGLCWLCSVAAPAAANDGPVAHRGLLPAARSPIAIGVKGWLALLVLHLCVFTPVQLALGAVGFYRALDEAIQAGLQLNPLWALLIAVGVVSPLAVGSVWAGRRLWRRQNARSVGYVKLYVALAPMATAAVVMALRDWLCPGGAWRLLDLQWLLPAITTPIAIVLYLQRSRRVRNTYFPLQASALAAAPQAAARAVSPMSSSSRSPSQLQVDILVSGSDAPMPSQQRPNGVGAG